MNIIYKTILIRFLIILGIFISVYSTIIFVILALLLLNIPSTHTYLAWVSDLYTLHLNFLIVGMGLLIGSIIFNRFNPSHDLVQKIKDRICGDNLRIYRILIKAVSFLGALIASYSFGYFLSFIVFYNIYNFSAVDIAVLFLNPLRIYIFFFLFGTLFSYIGLYFIKNHLRINESEMRTEIPRFLSSGNRILTSIGMMYSVIIIFLFGMGIYGIFVIDSFRFEGPYPPWVYSLEYIGGILGILSIFTFILFYGIIYYFRVNWYIFKRKTIKRMKFIDYKKCVLPILSLILTLITFFSPLFGNYMIYLLMDPYSFTYWDIFTTYTVLSFCSLFLLIGTIIYLSPKRIYELINPD
ncbi:MAG: hypothetical protein ACFE9S_02375 [Candidatus Hermodarchaeota archaeon]